METILISLAIYGTLSLLVLGSVAFYFFYKFLEWASKKR